MDIKIDTHTHTIASGHAYSTIREMAKEASKKNLQALAITEHGPAMSGSCHDFYFYNLKIVPRKYYGVPLFLGVELNILDESGEVDIPNHLLAQMDLVIASLHKAFFLGGHSEEIYTNAYINAMKNPYVRIIGHPDDSRCLPDLEKIVIAAKETDTLLEINNSSLSPTTFRVGTRDNVVDLLELCKKYKVKVTTGSDAHVDERVGAFGKTLEVFNECSFPEELVVTTDIEKLKPYLGNGREQSI